MLLSHKSGSNSINLIDFWYETVTLYRTRRQGSILIIIVQAIKLLPLFSTTYHLCDLLPRLVWTCTEPCLSLRHCGSARGNKSIVQSGSFKGSGWRWKAPLNVEGTFGTDGLDGWTLGRWLRLLQTSQEDSSSGSSNSNSSLTLIRSTRSAVTFQRVSLDLVVFVLFWWFHPIIN